MEWLLFAASETGNATPMAQLKGWGDAITSLASAVLLLFVLLLAAALFARLWNVRRRPLLIVDEPLNGTGIEDLEGREHALGALAREELVNQLTAVAAKVRQHPPGRDPWIDEFPVPRRLPDQGADELRATLSGLKPDAAGALFGLLERLVSPRGERVAMTLQRRSWDRAVGVSVEVTGLESGSAPALATLWRYLPLPPAPQSVATSSPASSQASAQGDGPAGVSVAANEANATSTAVSASSGNGNKQPGGAGGPPEPAPASADETHASAEAHYTLGQLHEHSGALQQARKHYEAGIEKDPGAVEARQAMTRLLSADHDPCERIIQIHPAAMRWVSIQLLERALLRHQDPLLDGSERRRERGEIHNFVGMILRWSSGRYREQEEFFTVRALEKFERAAECSDAYQPLENAGFTRTRWARHLAAAGRARDATRAFDQALEDYAAARMRIARAGGRVRRREWQLVDDRLTIYEALCRLRRDGSGDRSMADILVRTLSTGDWWAMPPEVRVLHYNLATYRSLAARASQPPHRVNPALDEHFLASVLLDRGLLSNALRDDDLELREHDADLIADLISELSSTAEFRAMPTRARVQTLRARLVKEGVQA